MWVSEGRILETDRLATNSMHHQGVRTVAPMLDPVAYGPDGLVEAVEVRDRSLSWGFSGTLNSLWARGKWGVFSPRLRRKLFAHILRRSMRVGVAVSISRRPRRKVVADNGICRWYLKDVRIYLGCRYLKETKSKLTLSIKEIPI